MVEIVGHSQTKGRDNREPKLQPKPARQSSTLLSGGRRRALQWAPPPTRHRGSRVTPAEGRDLSSRQTQYVVKDLKIGQPINSNKKVQKLQMALHAKA